LTTATNSISQRPSEIGQPGSHVLQTEMLHLDVGSSKALDALL